MIPRRIAVVGGGISGLAAAYFLSQARRAGVPLEEYLFEASPRLGGALRTERLEGCVVETGADSFLTEKPEAIELCQQLGLAEQLIGSEDQQRRTWILHRGKLVPLPEGFEFLVPTRLLAVARTPLLSLRDKWALAAEMFVRRRPPSHDESVAEFVERHFSRGLLENIVDPLLTAIYGGDPQRLSARAVLSRFVELEEKWGSLIGGVRHAVGERKRQGEEHKGAAPIRPPLFTTLRDGTESLATGLRARLDAARVVCGHRAVGLSPMAAGGYQVQFDGGQAFDADAAILALPAYEAARLLRDQDKLLAQTLAEVPYISSMIVALGYDARQVGPLPSGFGFLVPCKENRRLLACTFVGQKFRNRVPVGRMLLRCFLGGARDEAALALTDGEAGALVRRELREILGLAAEPLFLRVYRWNKALAQYAVGHLQRLHLIRARTAQHRGLFLCGNAYQGIGVPDCIRSGRLAAEDCLGHLRGA